MSLLGNFLKGLREGFTDGDPRPAPAPRRRSGRADEQRSSHRGPSEHDQREPRPDKQTQDRPAPPQRDRRRDFGDDDASDPDAPEPAAAPKRVHREPTEEEEHPIRDERPRRRPRLRGGDAVQIARDHLTELLGRQPEAVSGLVPGEQGWKVRFETVEVPRVPATTDVMATYEVELDDEGGLVGYRRLGRYYRNEAHGQE